MKAKSRRRLLISSVAMLLVAMLALGTATFAWFTTDTSTSASGVEVKTDKVSSLLVSSRTSEWVNDLDYGFNKTLNPVSSANGVDWFYATAAGSNAATAKNGTVNKIASNTAQAAENYMFYNMLNVKNAGSADIENPVYIELSGNITEKFNDAAAAKKYLRVALVESGCTTDAGRASATVKDAATFKSSVYGASNNDTALGILTATANTNGNIATTDTVTTAAGTTIKVKVGDTLAAGAAKYYMLIVWFEGQDADCYDTYAGNVMPELQFSIYEDKP